MVLYNDSDGLKMYTEYKRQDDGTGAVPVGTLVLSPGFNELSDTVYARFKNYLDVDEKVSLNAEKRKYGFSTMVHEGWYCEPPTRENQAREIWGSEPIPQGYGLVNQILCLKMNDGAGGFTRLHAVLYTGFSDNKARLAVGGEVVAVGQESGSTGLTRAWTLAVAPKKWIDLCQQNPIKARG